MDVEIKRNRRWVRWAAPAVVTVCVVVLMVAVSWNDADESLEGLRVEPVKRGPLIQTIRSAGVLEPVVQRRISSRLTGEVFAILVEPGDLVDESDELLVLANESLHGELSSARAAVAVAESELAARKLQLADQVLELERVIADRSSELRVAEARLHAEDILRQKGVVSGIQHATTLAEKERIERGIEFDERRLGLFRQNVESSLNAEEVKVGELRRRMELIQSQVDSLSVISGMSGVVQNISVSVGEAVSEGAELAIVSRMRPLRVRLQVPQGQAQLVTVGDESRLDIRGIAVPARVSAVAPVVVDGTVDVLLEALDELPDAARIALSVEADILVRLRNDTLWVERPDYISARDRSASLLRVSSNGSAVEHVLVELGMITRDAVEILSGINENDLVVLTSRE